MTQSVSTGNFSTYVSGSQGFSDSEYSVQTLPMNNFDTLVSALRDRLGPCSGINDDDVDPAELQSLMRDYLSKEVEWKKYALRAPGKAYTRNLVDKGNGKCNLVSLSVSVSRIAYLWKAHSGLVSGEKQPGA